VRLIIYIFYYY